MTRMMKILTIAPSAPETMPVARASTEPGTENGSGVNVTGSVDNQGSVAKFSIYTIY